MLCGRQKPKKTDFFSVKNLTNDSLNKKNRKLQKPQFPWEKQIFLP